MEGYQRPAEVEYSLFDRWVRVLNIYLVGIGSIKELYLITSSIGPQHKVQHRV